MNPRSAQRLFQTAYNRARQTLHQLQAILPLHSSNGRPTPSAGNSASARRVLRLSAILCLLASVALAAGTGVRTIPYDQMAATGQEPRLAKTLLNPAAGWVNSKVFVATGDLVNVTADGLIDPGVRLRRGPDGEGHDALKEMTRDCPYLSLVGRIGDGQVFCVGSNATYEIVEGGQLSFHVNELDALRFDDTGAFNIEVRVISPGKSNPKQKPLVAVLPLVPVGMTQAELQGVNLAARTRLARVNAFTLIDKTQVDRAIAGMPISDLATVEAARKAGRTAGADQVIFGQVARIDQNRYSVTLQRVTVSSGKVEQTRVETFDCLPERLPERVAAIAEGI